MRLLFVTDLHGDKAKYERVLTIAGERKISVVVYGGDLLPKAGGPLHEIQKAFISDFLEGHFAEYEHRQIYFWFVPGNDDLLTLDLLLEKLCRRHPHVMNIAGRKARIGGIDFIGYDHVRDYPFRLKDRCRRDSEGDICERQFGTALFSGPSGFSEIDDWPAYLRNLPTIENELDLLPRPKGMRKAVYVIHMPPANIGLDVCGDRTAVGSQAVFDFIKKNQPLVSLHGHIHESSSVSGIWKTRIGKTVCIQPGQMPFDLKYVIGDLETMEFELTVEAND